MILDSPTRLELSSLAGTSHVGLNVPYKYKMYTGFWRLSGHKNVN
jgi:hypothetical protein